MNNKPQIKREAGKALETINRNLQIYIDKNPDKSKIPFVLNQKYNITALKMMFDCFDNSEKENEIIIKDQERRIEELENAIHLIIDTLIFIDAEQAFNALSVMLTFNPDTAHSLAVKKGEVLKKFKLKNMYNAIEKIVCNG